MTQTVEFVGIERKTLSLLGSFLFMGGLLLLLSWIVYVLPLASMFTGGTLGIGTGHITERGYEFIVMNKWHLTSAQFDAYLLSAFFTMVFGKFGSWAMFLGIRINGEAKR